MAHTTLPFTSLLLVLWGTEKTSSVLKQTNKAACPEKHRQVGFLKEAVPHLQHHWAARFMIMWFPRLMAKGRGQNYARIHQAFWQALNATEVLLWWAFLFSGRVANSAGLFPMSLFLQWEKFFTWSIYGCDCQTSCVLSYEEIHWTNYRITLLALLLAFNNFIQENY